MSKNKFGNDELKNKLKFAKKDGEQKELKSVLEQHRLKIIKIKTSLKAGPEGNADTGI